MKRTVSKAALVKIIARHYKSYTRAEISDIIYREGAAFFNYERLNITYLNFERWQVVEI